MVEATRDSTAVARLITDRRGVSLIEVVVALVVLSVALSALAGLSYEVAQRSFSSSTETYANGIATEQLGQLSVLSYDSISARTGCVDVKDDYFPHERCLSMADASAKMVEVTLIITPEVAFSKADTVMFMRSKPKRYNPF